MLESVVLRVLTKMYTNIPMISIHIQVAILRLYAYW